MGEICLYISVLIRRRRWLALLSIVTFMPVNVHAEKANNVTHFEVTPYLWVASINATFSQQGGESPPVDSDYSFFSLDNLDGVASGKFSVRHDNWGFLSDFLYVAFEDTFLDSTSLETTAELKGTIIEVAALYAPRSIADVEVIAGLRQQDITYSLAALHRQGEYSVTWTDPFVGAIYKLLSRDKYGLDVRGDIGGFGIESDMAINVEAEFNFKMTRSISLNLGYRYLKVKAKESNFISDLSLDGLKLGLGFRF